MALVQGDNSANLAEVGIVSSKKGGLHVVPKPIPQVLGHYRLSVTSGTLAAGLAAAAPVFGFLNSHPSVIAIVTAFRLTFLPLTLFTAGTLSDITAFDAFLGVAWSVAFTGGTSINLAAANSLRVRQTMSLSNMADIRIATTVALGGAGPLFPAPYPFAQTLRTANRTNIATGNEEVQQPFSNGLSVDFEAGGHPIVLAQGDGIAVRNRTLWPGAGTGILRVEMAWAESTVY